MIEYIGNKKIDEKQAAVRFIGIGKFVVLKNDQLVPIPDNFEDDPKEIFGEEFDRVSEYRTFYDTEAEKFRLVEIIEDFVQPETYISIPENGGEIGGWMVGRIDTERTNNEIGDESSD